jgi:hypothetical protein
MSARARSVVACLCTLLWATVPGTSIAQSAVEQNSNVVGRTLPGYYRGIPAMQDNEASCAINPILPRNIVCAWNASGGSDDAIGDTWLRFSESLDGGRTFYNRYLNGSNLNPATSVGQQFGADPVMMCWPGGCGTVMLAATRAELGGEGGGIYIQWMADINTEAGFRKAFKVNLDQVYRSTGSKFADKPHALYMLDEDNPGTVDVTMDVEMPDGSTQQLTRSWPKARILVVFSLFNPSKNDIEILSTYTDDYGGNWSNPRQVALTSGQDQGVSLAAIGDTVFYGFRRFTNKGESDDFMGVVSNDRGSRMSKPFVVASDVCVYDVPTLPATEDSSLAAARTNDFPWVSQDGSNFIMVFSARRSSSDGGCMTIPTEPADSRIMAVVGSANGKNWSDVFEVAPNSGHGFQFMPVVECSLGVCQVAWWDSRRDSARTLQFLSAQNNDFADAAAQYFMSVPILADFNFPPGGDIGSVIQIRRTADMYTKKVRITGNSSLDTSEPVTRASRYRQVPYAGQLVEREFNPFNVKAYKTNAVPFMSDYSSMTSVRQRYVFDPDNPSQPPYWESNAGPNPLPNALVEPLFWLAWTDARNMRGQIYTAEIDGQPPYSRTPDAPPPETPMTGDNKQDRSTVVAEESLTAESVEDFNPLAGVCERIDSDPALGGRPGGGDLFYALNNRVKDSDIYGAMIENRATAWSLNPTKTLGAIQRTYVIVVENENITDGKVFRLEIMNQPVGYEDAPKTARASWRQLPFELDEPDFQTLAPTVRTFEAVGPQSSASVALFLVSEAPVNPVTVNVYEAAGDPDDPLDDLLVNSIVVNGSIESGPLLNADGTLNGHEEHNPFVYSPDPSDPTHYNLGHYENANPDLFNPDLYNPDLFNPDLYNPDLFNPDLFNPDLYNPDLFNPDLFNPDLYNPDLFNPDLFNPDLFNPDLFNPDLFNTTLTDSDMLHNAEIPQPDLTAAAYDENGMVSKVDVQFGIQNVGNTLTPYSVDFALSDPEVLQLIEDGFITTQVIAWRNKKIDDVQFCDHQLVTENRVIAAENNPDLTQLRIPTILDNRVGALTYFVAPGDILQNTLRFIGPKVHIQTVEKALKNDIISYVFTAETANTGTRELFDVEQVISDRTPPVFSTAGPIELEASGPLGAVLPNDFITATRSGEDVPVECRFASDGTIANNGDIVGLDIENDPPGPTEISCIAETTNGVVATLDTQISVEDTTPPFIIMSTMPADIVAEAGSSAGTVVSYTYPLAEDVFGVDPNVVVNCLPESGSLFQFLPPTGPTTEVICSATDASGNVSDPESFSVTLEDTSPPGFPDFDDLTFVPPGDLRQLDDFKILFDLQWGPFEVSDADPGLNVDCEPGDLVSANPPEYTFASQFPAGPTTVVCTATDSGGRSATVSFDVFVTDDTAPVITLLGDSTLTLDAGSGPYSDPGATALDNGHTDLTGDIVTDASEVDTSTVGTYTVYYSAIDEWGNTGTATRTVIVEFSYGMTGIIPTKTNVQNGSSNPFVWAWLDADGNAVDSSADMQYLRIEDCNTGTLIIDPAGDPGTSGFRFKADNWWQYNWDSTVPARGQYCAYVVSGLTGQEMRSPQIRVR